MPAPIRWVEFASPVLVARAGARAGVRAAPLVIYASLRLGSCQQLRGTGNLPLALSRPDSDVRLWAKLKCPVLPLVLTVCVPWFQYNAALKGSLEPALRVSPFS